MTTRDDAEQYLRLLARRPDADIEIGHAALMLASLDRPRVSLARYRRHLDEISDAVAERATDDDVGLDARAAILNGVIRDQLGYDGDRLNYDDLQNANLMRVIDRRRGIPVALGILYLHAARGQGWPMSGINFPGHFLLRLDAPPERLLLDPFDGEPIDGAAHLRALLKQVGGPKAELHPDHTVAASCIDVLLRLQHNIKLRCTKSGDFARALDATNSMLWLSPAEPLLWRDAGLLHVELDEMAGAAVAFGSYLEYATSEWQRGEAAMLLQDARQRLN